MPLKPITIRLPELQPFGLIAEAVSYRRTRIVTEMVRYANEGCFPLCPRCHIPIEREYMNFCDRCGQKLDWTAFGDEDCHLSGDS